MPGAFSNDLKEAPMNRNLVIGIAGGALALVLAGGAVLAGPSIATPSGAAAPTAAQSGVTAQATVVPTSQPGGGPLKGKGRGNAVLLVGLLGQATAQVSGIKPADVLAGVRAGKSLEQIAQEHGKSAKDVIDAARTKLQQRLKQAVDKGRMTQQQSDAALAQFDQTAAQMVADKNLAQQFRRPQLGAPQPRRGALPHQPVAAGLVRATAEVTGLQPAQVRAELRAGKSLAQIAQEHGKSADDILAKLREYGQQRLDQALNRAKDLINQPGLGRPNTPQGASPTAAPAK
jgi:uncharacterized protein (DUF433 family)